MFKLALASLYNRRLTALLAVITVALSVLLLVGVERIRTEARTSFANTVSGSDLIVGSRAGSVQLLLYSVFRVGNAINNIGWDSYQALARDPRVAWTIPLSLGDSHKGFAVLATNQDYFSHLQYADHQGLQLAGGRVFSKVHDAVLGAQVAAQLGYRLGDHLILTHGTGDAGLYDHKDQPFTVVGILAPTGTPVDDTVHISLEGMTAIHMGWQSGSPSLLSQTGVLAAAEDAAIPPPDNITAFMVGLKTRTALFAYQRKVNRYADEPLMAILPGVALSELWQMMKVAEQSLLAVSVFVMIIGLMGMLTALLTGLNERRREMAILRSIGVRIGQIFALIIGETLLLVSAGIVCGMALLYAVMAIARPILHTRYSLNLTLAPPTMHEWQLLAATLLAGAIIGIVPAWRAYRMSLADGLNPHV